MRILHAGLAAAALSVAAPARAEPPVERRLYPDRIEASSFLWNDWNRFQENYHQNYVGDDDPRTAWTHGTPGGGAGQWLRVHVTALRDATRLRLRIRNGYQKSRRLFARNQRARDVTVRLLPSGPAMRRSLSDTWDWQELVIERPAGPLAGFELRVDSVHPGSHYDDLCISDIQVFATAATRDNPLFERGKLRRLLAWKAARIEAARLFRSAAGKSMPVAPQYRSETRGGATVDAGERCQWNGACLAQEALALATRTWPGHRDTLQAARSALAGGFTGWLPARVSAVDRRAVPEVDGLHVASLGEFVEPVAGDQDGFELPQTGELGYLRADHLKRVYGHQGAPPLERILRGEAAGCSRGRRPVHHGFTPAAEITAGAGARPLRSLLLVSCGTVEEREGELAVARWQLLLYDGDGQLSFVIGPGQVTALEWRSGGAGPLLAAAERVTATGAPRRRFVGVTAGR
jgi:hypothetical protein